MNKLILSVLFILGAVLSSCSDDEPKEPKDKVDEISMWVAAEIGIMYVPSVEHPIECMLVRTEDDPGEWRQLSFEGIKGFSYERGHEYELRVKRTIMANPPMDRSDRYYELVIIVSDKLVAESEEPVEEIIKSESDIEYQEGCPINKYSISDRFVVNDEGSISYGDGQSAPSYENARIWFENILDMADPNWVEYQTILYQATYSYVISPLSENIRLVSNKSHGPMFKDVIPENEFNHIIQNMGPGEELRYVLIFANVYKKGIQKLEFVIAKTGEPSDNYKFKLVNAGVMPFMNDDFAVPAPFDNVSYKITDNHERFQAIGFPEFTQCYDSIVWCADGLPNTVRIYERQSTADSTEEHFTARWSTHFFKSGEIKNHLKGYRDGKVIYSTSLTTYLYERNFLCYDWIEGSIALQNPGNTGIYCLLDSEYEYQAGHTQEMNGTRYASINVWNKTGLPAADFLSVAQEALTKLMADNIGQAQSASGKVGAFKCLPSEGVEAIEFWENKTTRVLLLHRLPDENGLEKYYLHFEAK